MSQSDSAVFSRLKASEPEATVEETRRLASVVDFSDDENDEFDDFEDIEKRQAKGSRHRGSTSFQRQLACLSVAISLIVFLTYFLAKASKPEIVLQLPEKTPPKDFLRYLPPCWDDTSFGPAPEGFEMFTPRSCSRAIEVPGDETLFKRVAKRLKAGQCIRVVTFGGSVTCGDCVGKQYAWALKLITFLNSQFPCGGKGHILDNLCKGATGTNQAFESAGEHQQSMRNADLIFVEKASNDIETGELGKEWKPEGHEATDSIGYWTEAMIRRLKVQAPQAGIIWAELAWRYWRDKECLSKRNTHCQPPYHTDASRAHERVLQYYDIPQLSMLRMLGPFGVPERRTWLEKYYYCDGYHPSQTGHKLAASMIGHFLLEMVVNVDDLDSFFGDAAQAQVLPPPLILTAADLEKLEKKPSLVLDFTSEETTKKSALMLSAGDEAWHYGTDLASKPSTLMTYQESCTTLNLGTFSTPVTRLTFFWLFSYEGFGKAQLKLWEGVPLGEANSDLTTMPKHTLMTTTTDCFWTSKTSQTFQKELYVPNKEITQNAQAVKYLDICSLPGHESATKLKLFKIQIFA